MTPQGPAGTAPGAMIARQAIVNGQHSVIGYELFNRSRAGVAHTAATDVFLVFTALSHAGTEELVGKKLIFVNCTHESLAGGHLELVDPDKVVLEIPPLGHAAAAEVGTRLPILQALRERGFHLAFNHTVLESAYAPWLPLADYIKLDLPCWRPNSSRCSSSTPDVTRAPNSSRKRWKPRSSTTWGPAWACSSSRVSGSRAPRWSRPSCSLRRRPTSST